MNISTSFIKICMVIDSTYQHVPVINLIISHAGLLFSPRARAYVISNTKVGGACMHLLGGWGCDTLYCTSE